MHAIGHVAANLSFAAVAISLTHTVKTLEPAFNVVLSQLILGAWPRLRLGCLAGWPPGWLERRGVLGRRGGVGRGRGGALRSV